MHKIFKKILNLPGLLTVAAALLAAGSCRSADDDVFMDPAAHNTREQNVIESNRAPVRKPVSIATATYRVRVLGKSGGELCSGALDLELMSDLGFGPSKGGVLCMGQTIDLGRLLQGLTASADSDLDLLVDGMMVRARRIGGVAFNPPRPLLVGPIVQDTTPFAGLNQTSQHDATWKNPENGKLVNSSGTTTVKVKGVNEHFESTTLGQQFDRILRWEITSTGYDGIPKSEAFIFDRIEMLWNVRPLVIPRIVIEGNLRSFLSDDSQSAGRIAELFVGRVQIVMEATRFETL